MFFIRSFHVRNFLIALTKDRFADWYFDVIEVLKHFLQQIEAELQKAKCLKSFALKKEKTFEAARRQSFPKMPLIARSRQFLYFFASKLEARAGLENVKRW